MDYEKLAANAQALDKVVTFANTVHTMLLGDDFIPEETEQLKQYKCVNEFFELPIGDEKENDLKKLFTAAVKVADERGVLPFEIPDDPVALATAIDNGLDKAKMAYKVFTGELTLEDAADMLIDNETSKFIARVELAFDSGLANHVITETVVKLSYAIPYVGEAVGPFLETQRETISKVVKYAEPYIKKGVISGIGTLNKYSKKAAHKVISFVREKSRNLFSKLFG